MERDLIIEKYIKLAISLGSRLSPRNHLKDDYVGEAFLGLVVAAEALKDRPEILGNDQLNYVETSIRRRLSAFRCRSVQIRVDIKTWRKMQAIGVEPIQIKLKRDFSEVPGPLMLQISPQAYIQDIAQTPLEYQILSYRAEGRNDVEIGELLHLTKARIGQIKNEVAKRLGYI